MPPAWIETFEEMRRQMSPTLNKVEEGVRRLKSGDPATMRSLARLVHDTQTIVDKVQEGGLRKLTEDWVEDKIESRAAEILKELRLKDDDEIPSTAFVTEVNESEPGTSPCYTQEPESMEPSSASVAFSQTAHNLVSLVAQTMANFEPPSPQHFKTETTPSNAHDEAPLPTIPTTARIIHNVVAGTATMVEKMFCSAEQQTVLAGEDAQLAIDALHDQVFATASDITSPFKRLHSIRLLKRLCITHDKLPRKLFLPDVQCNVAAGPIFWGSFADIYWGTYEGKPVALKFLRMFQSSSTYKGAKLKKSFCREALTWSHSSKHPYVLPLFGINDTCFKHGMCMVIPWMKNGRIGDYIEQLQDEDQFADGRLRVDRWISQIAQGLESLHEEEVIHGDLRAGNILLDDDLNARVADFGLAVVAEDYITQTSTGGRMPNWLAPELIDQMSPSHPSKASDIYSFGCVCIELYTGKPPYSGLALYPILRKVQTGEKPPRPNFYGGDLMSEELWSIVARCLSTLPADRPTASDLVAALGKL